MCHELLLLLLLMLMLLLLLMLKPRLYAAATKISSTFSARTAVSAQGLLSKRSTPYQLYREVAWRGGNGTKCCTQDHR